MEFDKEFLGKLLEQAMENSRLRQNFDLRTSSADTSQRMLNALQPQTEVPIHRHEKTSETVICLVGKLVQSPNQKIPNRKTKCVIETHLNIKQNVILGANLKPV